jgi:phage-related protein
MTAMLSISGVNAWNYGLILSSAPSWLDAPSRTFQTIVIPGRAGVTPLAEATETLKTLTLKGVVQGETPSEARGNLDKLKVALRTGSVTVSLSDRPGVFIYVDFQSLTSIPSEAGSLIACKLPVEITLQCADPFWYDTNFSSVSIASGTSSDIALGSGPVRPLLTLLGPSTNPAISLNDYLGTLYQEMIFNGLSLSTGDALVIDNDAMTIKKNGTNALLSLTAGDFIKIEASDVAYYDTSSWPTIGLTGGGTLSVAYRKTWR